MEETNLSLSIFSLTGLFSFSRFIFCIFYTIRLSERIDTGTHDSVTSRDWVIGFLVFSIASSIFAYFATRKLTLVDTLEAYYLQVIIVLNFVFTIPEFVTTMYLFEGKNGKHLVKTPDVYLAYVIFNIAAWPILWVALWMRSNKLSSEHERLSSKKRSGSQSGSRSPSPPKYGNMRGRYHPAQY